MTEAPSRLVNLRRLANVAAVIGILAGLALIGLAVWRGYQLRQAYALAANVHVPGLLGVTGLLVVAGSVVGRAVASLVFKIEANLYHAHDVLLDVLDEVRAHKASLEQIAENVQLSDATKSIARRDKERKALHDAIQEEILRGNWNAAYYLVDELEKRYGYRDEAMRLREEVDTWQGRAKEQRVAQGVKEVEAAIERHDWQRARLLTAHMQQTFAGDERMADLPTRVHEAFERRKSELLQAWRDGLGKQETDKALQLLKELDQYLTPAEAQDLREPARTLFKRRLQDLGKQFTSAYKIKDYDTALEVAGKIRAEYPTSKMAQEVRVLVEHINRQQASAESPAV